MNRIARLIVVVPLALLVGGCESTSSPTMAPDAKPLSGKLVYSGFDLGSVSAGTAYSCGLARGGLEYCWGVNDAD